MSQYVAAIDQGTTSTRCMIFDHSGGVVSVDQREHEQIFPQAGWVEHDPEEIWRNTREVCAGALAKGDLVSSDVAAVGITNQRETAVVCDRTCAKPASTATVWTAPRTDRIVNELARDGGPARHPARTALPRATSPSGPKVKPTRDNVDGARPKAEAGAPPFGNI